VLLAAFLFFEGGLSMVPNYQRILTIQTHLGSKGNSLRTCELAIRQTALEARRAGISVVPILPDGTKRPAVRWRLYQQRLASTRKIEHWFSREARGLALVTGSISGGLEALDFDSRSMYEAWSERLQQQGFESLQDRLTRGYLEASPQGMHLLYRSSSVERNQKLASVPIDGPQRFRVLIETRGEGGLVVVAPSGGRVHPSGTPYVLLEGGMSTIATITAEERQVLFSVARSFDQTPPEYALKGVPPCARAAQVRGERPGDCYNRRASWAEVLEPHGWRALYSRDGICYWQRPEKQGSAISATTNYRESDLLYVFTTSTPFEAGRAYSKFAAYAILEHGGDFSAARILASRGYGGDDSAGN
jgi:hypothetical protein